MDGMKTAWRKVILCLVILCLNYKRGKFFQKASRRIETISPETSSLQNLHDPCKQLGLQPKSNELSLTCFRLECHMIRLVLFGFTLKIILISLQKLDQREPRLDIKGGYCNHPEVKVTAFELGWWQKRRKDMNIFERNFGGELGRAY